jgi:hypothetical protein
MSFCGRNGRFIYFKRANREVGQITALTTNAAIRSLPRRKLFMAFASCEKLRRLNRLLDPKPRHIEGR